MGSIFLATAVSTVYGKLVYHSRGKEGQFALDVLLLDSIMGGEYISVQDTLSHDEGRERAKRSA